VRGMAIHDAVEWFLTARLKELAPDLTGMQRQFELHSLPETIKSWEKRGGITWKDYSVEEMHDDGLRALAAWEGQPAREFATDAELPPIGKNLKPVMVEETFDVKFSNVEWYFTGRIDTYCDKKILHDLKTTGKNTPVNQAMISDQLTGEQMGLEERGMMVTGLEIDQLVILKGRVDVVVHRAAPRTPEEIQSWLQDTGEIARAIEARQFPRVRDYQTCSYCEYQAQCSPDFARAGEIAAELQKKRDAEKAAEKEAKESAKADKPKKAKGGK